MSMNYRLGIFGFLTLGDESLPGNLGMISFLVCIYIFTCKRKLWGHGLSCELIKAFFSYKFFIQVCGINLVV